MNFGGGLEGSRIGYGWLIPMSTESSRSVLETRNRFVTMDVRIHLNLLLQGQGQIIFVPCDLPLWSKEDYV